MPYVINAPPMFTFHHVNAYQVPAGGSNTTNGANGGSGKQLLVLDTVGWDEISFEHSQHNLTKDYYKGKSMNPLLRDVCNESMQSCAAQPGMKPGFGSAGEKRTL